MWYVSHAAADQASAQSPPLGVQLYSVRDDIGPGDLGRTLGRLAAMGFTHVEPYRILENTGELAAALDDTGLTATAAHANVVAGELDAYLVAAERLGLSTLIVPWAERQPCWTATASGNWPRPSTRRRVRPHTTASASATTITTLSSGSGWTGYAPTTSSWTRSPTASSSNSTRTGRASAARTSSSSCRGSAGRIRFLHVTNEPPDDDDPPVLGVDITGRMDEVVKAGYRAGAMTVLEVVVHDGDVFPVLERNAAYFTERLRAAGQVPW